MKKKKSIWDFLKPSSFEYENKMVKKKNVKTKGGNLERK